MQWLTRVAQVRGFTEQARREGRRVGLVPTMGALHEGHLSLVRQARQDCDPVVVSVFVNPAQFGPTEDYRQYPRDLERDGSLLESLGAAAVFAPALEEVYPKGFDTWVEPGKFGDRLEGAHRPGHLRGVGTVVLKLFNMVQPHAAFFGQKDFQQMLLIRRMVRDLSLDLEIVSCPIVREDDGLALSSRNVYLQGADRVAAQVLSRSLKTAQQLVGSGERDAVRIVEEMKKVFAAEPRARLDYAEIADADNLEPLRRLDSCGVALVAARVGPARLIDNTLLKIS